MENEPETVPRQPIHPGRQGPQGLQGPLGRNCWDLNGNGLKNLPNEDTNSDGLVDLADCEGAQGAMGARGLTGPQGIQGNQGPRGLQGPAGRICWDLNGNGLKNLPSEDTNGDGVINLADCEGPQRAPRDHAA